VKGLAELHGGSLTIESRLGIGTTADRCLADRGPPAARPVLSAREED